MTFDELLKSATPGPFDTYYLVPKNVPSDMQNTPPVPCDFKPGDRVVYTNDQGVKFSPRIVRGFTAEVQSWGAFIYIDSDCWWCPVKPKNLRLL